MKTIAVRTASGGRGYLTLQAADALKYAVFTPENMGKNKVFYTAAKFFLGKKIVLLPFPGGEGRRDGHAAETTLHHTDDGKTGVFLSAGDAVIYRTFTSILPHLQKNGVTVTVVSSAPSFAAAAVRVCIPPVQKGRAFTVTGTVNDNLFGLGGAIAFFKTLYRKEDGLDSFEAHNLYYTYIRRVPMEGGLILNSPENEKFLLKRIIILMILGIER